MDFTLIMNLIVPHVKLEVYQRRGVQFVIFANLVTLS